MVNRKAYRVLPINQLLLILLAVLVVYLAVDFGRLVGVSRQRREELGQLELETQVAQAETAELEKQYEYATSPRSAEEWALRNGLSRPDEALVMFVGSAANPALDTDKAPKADTTPGSPRETWWDLFFGAR